MSSIVISGDTSGAITLAAPAVSGTNTATLPAATGTVALLQTPSFATTIGVGGATPAASGAGITFPATQSASSDANTLDDYEEGTWTPVLAGSSGVSGQSYYQQAGRYTKIGNICIAEFDAGLTALGTVSGNAQINGLPFSAANTGDISQGSGSLSLFASLATSLVSANIGPQPNGNWINLRGLTAASGSTTNSFVATAFFNSSSRLSGTIIYQVA